MIDHHYQKRLTQRPRPYTNISVSVYHFQLAQDLLSVPGCLTLMFWPFFPPLNLNASDFFYVEIQQPNIEQPHLGMAD